MLVSFLVPVYNTEKYLKRCIDSLLIQKGCPFEIVLLNDGSTDNCPDICNQYQSAWPDIVKVIHKNNEGLLLTRRRGFKEAKGDWFICIDSDDYVAPELLQSVVQVIDSYADCDMVMYNYNYVDDVGNSSPSRMNLKDKSVYCGENKQQLYNARLTSTTVNSMCLRAIRRDIVDIEADYSKFGIKNMCEDAVQVLPLYTNAKKTVYIDKPLYCYRKGSESITGKTTFANWQAINRSFVLEEKYITLWQISKEVSCQRYTKQLENICNCVRWLHKELKNTDYVSLLEAIIAVKKESMFKECFENYDKKYASSSYSRISMPIIANAVSKERFGFLKFFLRLEGWLLKR